MPGVWSDFGTWHSSATRVVAHEHDVVSIHVSRSFIYRIGLHVESSQLLKEVNTPRVGPHRANKPLPDGCVEEFINYYQVVVVSTSIVLRMQTWNCNKVQTKY